MKTLYEKVGTRYVVWTGIVSDVWMNLSPGSYLIQVDNHGTTLSPVEANRAAMLAAGVIAEDAISKAIQAALKARPSKTQLTVEQQTAWDAATTAMGDDIFALSYASCQDAAKAGVSAMADEAHTLMQYPAVERQWEKFLTVARLSQGHV